MKVGEPILAGRGWAKCTSRAPFDHSGEAKEGIGGRTTAERRNDACGGVRRNVSELV